METSRRWRCREDGDVEKVEMWRRWRCREDGDVETIEVRRRWRDVEKIESGLVQCSVVRKDSLCELREGEREKRGRARVYKVGGGTRCENKRGRGEGSRTQARVQSESERLDNVVSPNHRAAFPYRVSQKHGFLDHQAY
jgi:hypothetical protein